MTDPRATGPAAGRAVTSLRPDEPMTDDLCLFVLTLVADGRRVPESLVTRARAHAAAHPACAERA